MQTTSKYSIVFFSITFIIALTCFNDLTAQEDKFVVVLDAGHGGGDSGNVGNGHREKDIALKIVLQIGKDLESNNDIKVIYTRKKDVFVELYERANIANKADADLFVSVHCNSVANPKPYGTETWVLGEKNTGKNFEVAKRENEVIFLEDNYEENYEGFDPSSPESTIAIGIEQEIYVEQSIVLARKIEDFFKAKAKRKSRGLKQASLLVIRNTYMPSVLVEVGFLTNKREGTFLNSKNGQSIMARSIRDAILAYKSELDQNIGSHINGMASSEVDEAGYSEVKEGVVLKIQIAASSKVLETKSYNFKGLPAISRAKVGPIYKYYSGDSSDYSDILNLLRKAKSKGYKDAFVVAFRDGNKIELEDAFKSASN